MDKPKPDKRYNERFAMSNAVVVFDLGLQKYAGLDIGSTVTYIVIDLIKYKTDITMNTRRITMNLCRRERINRN